MNIILDTNIIRQDFRLNSNKFEALFAYLLKTDSKFVLPEVVIQEACQEYRNELQSHISKIGDFSEKIRRMSFTDSTSIMFNCDLDAEVEKYRALLHKPRTRKTTVVLPNKSEYMAETVSRLIEGRKPASGRAKEFRDILIWLALKDYIHSKSDPVIFISANTKEFGAEEGKVLAYELQKELSQENLSLIFYSSIEVFLKGHASRVDFVTKEWINEHLSDDSVQDLALPAIQGRDSSFESFVERETPDTFTGSFYVTGVSLILDDFFVYDMDPEGLYLNLTYWGDAQIEVELDKGKYDYLYGGVEVYLSAKIHNDEIVDIEIDEVDI